MNKSKHLLLWSSVAALALLVTAAVQENFLKDWRRVQASVTSPAGPLDVRLRQVVVPKLRVADRCVSCHVGMAPGEQGIEGNPLAAAHKPIPHDPAEFGCTVCHAGQGLATEKDDAHGDVHFWPEPMIPVASAEAGCGTCHTHIRVPNTAELARGRNLLERYDCLACHRVDGRGGTLRPDGASGMEGPDLSHVGAAGFDAQWYQKHAQQHQAAQGGPWKTAFGPLEPAEVEAIGSYLECRVGAPRLVEAKALFNSLGCRGCHKVGGVGGDDGPDLTNVGERDPARIDFSHVSGEHTIAAWLTEHTRAPAKVVLNSQMPAFGLSGEQLDKLTFYMLSLRRSDVPEAYWPKDRIRVQRFGEREFGTDGATLFGTFCTGCHGPAGEGRRFAGMQPFPAIGNADFHAAATDEFLIETIRRGRPGRRMPSWGEMEGGLRPEEIRAIVAHLRRTSGVTAPSPKHDQRRWVKAEAGAGQQLYTALCAGCHGQKGEGPEAPALSNPVLQAVASDDYFIETIGRGRHGTPMNGFLKPSSVFPTLAPADIEAIVAYLRTWETQK